MEALIIYFKENAHSVIKAIEDTDPFNRKIMNKLISYNYIYNITSNNLINEIKTINILGNLYLDILDIYISILKENTYTSFYQYHKTYENFSLYVMVHIMYFLQVVNRYNHMECMENIINSGTVNKGDDGKKIYLNLSVERGKKLFLNLSNKLYNDRFYKDIFQDMLKEKIFAFINKERENFALPSPEWKDVGECIRLFHSLNDDETYESFENNLMDSTKSYYNTRAAKWIEEMNCTEYFTHIYTVFCFEETNITSYLPDKSKKKITDTFLKETIGNFQTIAFTKTNGPHYLLTNLSDENYMKLKHIHFMVDKAEKIDDKGTFIEPLLQILNKYTLDKDIQSLSNFINMKEKITITKIKEKIEHLILIMKKYMKLQVVAFSNNVKTQKIFTENLKKELNAPANRYIEFINLWINSQMKGSPEDFPIVIQLCYLFQDRDIFLETYKRHYTIRLLSEKKNLNEDNEKMMMSLLKEKVGIFQTHHLEKMYNDIQTSEDIVNSLDSSTLSINMGETIIISEGIWKNVNTIGSLPPKLAKSFNEFKQQYLTKFPKRTLNFDITKGRAEIKFKSYNIEVSTIQLCILTFIQDEQTFNKKDIFQSLKIDQKTFDHHFVNLITKDLKKREYDNLLNYEEPNLQFNDDFKSKRRNISFLPSFLDSQSKEDSSQVQKSVVEDRKYEIDAALVKVLKTHRTINIQELIAKTSDLLIQRFIPKPADIKKQLEYLIEREYAERSEEDRNILKYLP